MKESGNGSEVEGGSESVGDKLDSGKGKRGEDEVRGVRVW